MIPYHGTPIGGPHDRAAESLIGRHAFVSYAAPSQMDIVREVCQSFALDNGAFSAWKSKRKTDWDGYYRWVEELAKEPHFDFACIPDVIDGTEEEQDRLLAEWPHGDKGAPVWHMNESLLRLARLMEKYPRICLGSTGDFATVGTVRWWHRIAEAMSVLCDDDGRPMVKIHGLRMLDPEVFTRIPFTSADSTNAAFNCHVDAHWKGTYEPPKPWRARVLMARIESFNAPSRWTHHGLQTDFFETFERVHPKHCPEIA